MAYQNVGSPRFYINVMEWLHSINGLTSYTNLDMIFTNPERGLTTPTKDYAWSGNEDRPFFPEPVIPLRELIGDKGFVAHLGHNYASCELSVQVDQGEPLWGAAEYIENIINAEKLSPVSNQMKPDYDGFSIYLADYTNQAPQTNPRLFYNYNGIDQQNIYNGLDVKVGSIILGPYWECHSPDLKLTMTREMDGVKSIRTKGGSDLVNHKYIKAPIWTDENGVGGSAWELYSGNQTNKTLSRSGRRAWNLSFSYLQDSDLFPDVGSLTNYESISPDGNVWSDEDNVTLNTLLDDNNFYSQVIHKTNGGQNRFLFQADSSNNNIDQFAVCKLDMSSFQFKQVANNIYNVKLKIREVW